MTTKRAKSVERKVAKKRPKKTTGHPPVVPIEMRPPSEIRGMLPTPPEVAALVEREVKERPMTAAARLRVTNGFNLQYYFGGHHFLYRETPLGVEVLAVGSEEIRRLYRKLPPEQHGGIIMGDAEPWF